MGGDITTPLTSRESNGRQTTSSSDFPPSISGDKESSNLQAPATGNTTLVEKKYLSGDFWANLGGEVDGLRSLLERPSDYDDNDDEEVVESTPLTTGPTNHSSPLDFVFHEAESRPEQVSNNTPSLQGPYQQLFYECRSNFQNSSQTNDPLFYSCWYERLFCAAK
jgi:hypothetical protein